MAKPTTLKPSVPQVPVNIPMTELQELLRIFGQIINSSSLYGMSHKISQQAMDEGFNRLTRLLVDCPSFTFSLVEGSLLIEGQAADVRNQFAAVFFRKLSALNIEHFSLNRGITREELGKLLEIFATPPDRLRAQGAFADLLARYGLGHIHAGASSFQRITDEQVVLKKDDFVQGVSGAGSEEKAKVMEQIVAFLKGDVAGNAEKAAKEGSDPATDAQKLADLIMKSAEIAPKATSIEGGESLVDLVVGSLRRQADKLMDSPANRTQSGKKNLAKMFMMLEKNVLDKLRSMATASPDDLAAVEEAFDEIKTDLTVDTLAAEYMKKRSAMADTEKKVLKFIQRSSAKNAETCDVLKDKLLENGLTMDGWHELRVRGSSSAGGSGTLEGAKAGMTGQGGSGGTETGGAGTGGPGTGSAGLEMQGIASLAMLLSELDTLLAPNRSPDGEEEVKTQIATVAAKINLQVEGLVARTETKMQSLVDTSLQILEEEKKWDKAIAQKAKLSRRALMALLAEIVQELCQPLSVVSCALDMTVSRRLGEINEEQTEMLQLSMTSCLRLQKLVEKLRDICGNPETLTPDSQMLKYIYS